MPAPDLETRESSFAAEPGWRTLSFPRSFGKGRSFVSGDPEGNRLRVHYFLRETDKVLCAKVWFGPDAEGPPGHAHGGSIAAVLDEAMGFSAWVTGHPVVAATISVNFLKKLPLHQVVVVEARIEQVEEAKVFTQAHVFDLATGKHFANAIGLFIEQPAEHFGALARGLHAADT